MLQNLVQYKHNDQSLNHLSYNAMIYRWCSMFFKSTKEMQKLNKTLEDKNYASYYCLSVYTYEGLSRDQNLTCKDQLCLSGIILSLGQLACENERIFSLY
jgi:biotin synthase-related radical SAM superfamily protein